MSEETTTQDAEVREAEVKQLKADAAPAQPTEFKITRENLDNIAKNIEELIPNKYKRIAIFQLINDNLESL